MKKSICSIRPTFTVTQQPFGSLHSYTIVYPTDNKRALVLAKYLRAFIERTDGCRLSIVSDSAAVTAHELLIGNTNRYTSALEENEFAVSVQGERLVFEGGHDAMIEAAVKWFIAAPRVSRRIATLRGRSEDFKASIILNGERYDYVWGDEFDGNFFDQTKFVQRSHMGGGTPSCYVLKGENDTLRVEDGKMKMTAIRYHDASDPKVKFAVPECVCTDDTMWWMYGYAEIRAKVPFRIGSWPAWWSTNYCHTMAGKTGEWQYLSEIDFFEMFGLKGHQNIQPNIHKWYKNYAGDFTEVKDGEGKRIEHTDYSNMRLPRTFFEMPEDERDGYHTYGFKWTPTEMTMSVDGEDYMTFDLTFNFDGLTDMSDWHKTPQHMIFDNWLFTPGMGFPYGANEATEQTVPAEFFVEYVRLYQKPGEGYVRNIGVNKDI